VPGELLIPAALHARLTDMRGMKVTVDAAMRARDVSRPRADDEASARESDAEAAAARGETGPAAGAPVPAPPDAAAGRPEAESMQPTRRPHRRRRRR
jgi:hypothetical protein